MTEYTINRLGHRGDGIADGPVFAPLTLPTEIVTGALDGDKLLSPKIISPSADRVAAPCKHFKRCGGCALQHASDAFVADWKASIVTEALSAHGLDAPIRNVDTSPAQSRRRATFAGKRTKSGVIIGFHGRGSDVVFDTPDCILVSPEILQTRPALEELTLFGASRKHALTLTVTWSLGGADVAVLDGKDPKPAELPELIAIGQRHGLARLTWNQEVLAEFHKPEQSFDGIRVTPPPGAFLQATEYGQNALCSAVLETVSGAKNVVDLFAGCGTFALPVSRHATVHAVEGDAAMTTALDRAWRVASGLHTVSTEKRDLFRRPLHASELGKFDAAIIDPPRAGAEAQITEIADSGIGIVAMVSCNPITFARDAKTLIDAGYALNWIEVVDQFRWSPHIELAASFTK